MTIARVLITSVLLATLSVAARAEAPKVVKSSPENGAKDVDPDNAELRVVFDQPMSPRGRSVVNSRSRLFPEFVGQPAWEDDKTFVWKMKLEPETDYWLSINGTRFTNFRGQNGEPAVPYPISFRTGPGKPKVLTPEMIALNKAAIEKLRKAIDEDYSYRDLRKVDWDKAFSEHAPRLESAGGPAEFASRAARMLEAAQDVHLMMKAGERRIATWRRDVFPMVNLQALQRTVPQWKQRGNFVFTGQFDNGVTYLSITSLPADDPAFLVSIYEAIGEAALAGKGLVIDLRPNGGGDEITGRKIAGCFLDKPAVYAKHVMRAGGKDSEQRERVVQPNPGGPKYRGKVIVLTGPATLSSCEALVLMMKQVPECVTVGGTTGGSSGNPRSIDLGNGTSISVPQWKAMRPDGTVFEGEGIRPDVEVKAGPADFAGKDPVLEEALKKL